MDTLFATAILSGPRYRYSMHYLLAKPSLIIPDIDAQPHRLLQSTDVLLA